MAARDDFPSPPGLFLRRIVPYHLKASYLKVPYLIPTSAPNSAESVSLGGGRCGTAPQSPFVAETRLCTWRPANHCRPHSTSTKLGYHEPHQTRSGWPFFVSPAKASSVTMMSSGVLRSMSRLGRVGFRQYLRWELGTRAALQLLCAPYEVKAHETTCF